MNYSLPAAQLKVGIWCKYHTTLEPSEGIGVFAHNLARGIAAIPGGPEVVLAINTGDEGLVRETLEIGQGRITTAAPKVQEQSTKTSVPSKWRKLVSRLDSKFDRQIERCNRRDAAHFNRQFRKWRLLPQDPSRSGVAAIPLTAVARTLALGNKLYRLFAKAGKSACRMLARPTEVETDPRIFQQQQCKEIMEGADVWLIPYVGLDLVFNKPTVVVIHDLVCYHYPETLAPKALEVFKSIVPRTARRSTIAATMSNFIRQNDLEGILKLPAEKTRVLEPAAPRDFGEAGNLEEATADYPILNKDYIFYPSAFRAYKNHTALVQALAMLRYAGDNDLHLVFTGNDKVPPAITKMAHSFGLEDRVHLLGRVPRSTLALLYQQAAMTVVPSYYEQGSFPIMEAIHWGCPVACSSIPSLVELFRPMGTAMKFFDPDRIDEAANVMGEIRRNRAEILADQQAASKQMFARTWTDAGKDWVKVFEEAIAMYGNSPKANAEAPARLPQKRAA